MNLDDPQTRILAANTLLEIAGSGERVTELDMATATLAAFLHQLLDGGQYIEAALLLWGGTIFNPNPRSVRMTWNALTNYNKNLIIGSSSMGKSYNMIVWELLRWIHDPEYTNIKNVSTTEAHAKAGTWTHLVELHAKASIPLPGEATATFLGLDPINKRAGISVVALRQGDKGKGSLQGFHPVPRDKPHPIFGPLSAVILIIDEGEEVPNGLWEGVDNMLANEDEYGSVKIVSSTNPKNRESILAQRAKPVGGWDSVHVDIDEEWDSAQGWHVTRLDAAKSENVKQKRMVEQGLQTHQGYQNIARRGTGDSAYWCVDEETEVLSGRGWLRHGDLAAGDKIYTVSPYTGLAEWRPILEVFSEDYSGALIAMEGIGVSALVTPNHRWAVTNKARAKTSQRLVFKETSKLARHDLIPLIRESEDFPGEKYSDDFCSLAGWVTTDGTYAKIKQGKRVSIGQSSGANAEKCQSIRELLTRLGVQYAEHRGTRDIINFAFSGVWAQQLRSVMPDKKLSMGFINQLTRSNLAALLDAVIAGDGGIQGGDYAKGRGRRSGTGTRYCCTNDPSQADIYSIIAARLGMASRIHVKRMPAHAMHGTYHYAERDMFFVNLKVAKYARIQYLKMLEVEYEGKVWCPRTDNGTFYARRNGIPYFTGNTFARGWWPEQGVELQVMPPYTFKDAIGIYVFTKPPIPCASFDPAFAEGGDSPILTTGRFGYASAFDPVDGPRITYNRPRWVIQIEQQFPIQKDNATIMANSVQELCIRLGVRPEWFVVDKTGAGQSIHDPLILTFGAILGVLWGAGATDKKILEEDTEIASELYYGLVSEMWFAAQQWIEYGYMKFAPSMNTEKLFSQFRARRFEFVSKTLRKVESKDAYKARTTNDSPDEADSCIQIPHLIRMRQATNAAMMPDRVKRDGRGQPVWNPESIKSVVDKIDFMSDDGT